VSRNSQHPGPVARFNLVDVADGGAELGFRVAERATGRGVAKDGVRRTCELARDEYGLRRLVASATLETPARSRCSGAPGSRRSAR
jgi:ribosomal-protein-alanine N-acetyltransferase